MDSCKWRRTPSLDEPRFYENWQKQVRKSKEVWKLQVFVEISKFLLEGWRWRCILFTFLRITFKSIRISCKSINTAAKYSRTGHIYQSNSLMKKMICSAINLFSSLNFPVLFLIVHKTNRINQTKSPTLL